MGGSQRTALRLRTLKLAEKIGNRLVAAAHVEKIPDEVRHVWETEGEAVGGTPGLILEALKEANKALSPAQIIASVHKADKSVPTPRIYAALSRLSLHQKQIVRGSDGRYRLPGSSDDAGDLF